MPGFTGCVESKKNMPRIGYRPKSVIKAPDSVRAVGVEGHAD